jgi:23S rRNA (pseudouridine1915-N3)-methyltransferase
MDIVCGIMNRRHGIVQRLASSELEAVYARLDIRELPDKKTPESMSPAEEQVRVREGERILAALRDGAHVIALAIDGKSWSSKQLAVCLERKAFYSGGGPKFAL